MKYIDKKEKRRERRVMRRHHFTSNSSECKSFVKKLLRLTCEKMADTKS
jgi:hypothetical protein